MANESAVLDERQAAGQERLFSLAEVAEETGIGMPTLLRYQRENPQRVPSEGSGRQQRFPEQAFRIFRQIRDEELAERETPGRGGPGLMSLTRVRQAKKEGRPVEAGRRPRMIDDDHEIEVESDGTPEATHNELEPNDADETMSQADHATNSDETRETGPAELTLRDISEATGIAYPTIARYASRHGDSIPHEGNGRKRRFPKEAIDVFLDIRKNTRRGRPPKQKDGSSGTSTRISAADRATLERRIQVLEESQNRLEQQIRELIDRLDTPVSTTVEAPAARSAG